MGAGGGGRLRPGVAMRAQERGSGEPDSQMDYFGGIAWAAVPAFSPCFRVIYPGRVDPSSGRGRHDLGAQYRLDDDWLDHRRA